MRQALTGWFVLLLVSGCSTAPVDTTRDLSVPTGTRIEVVKIATRGVTMPATFVVPPQAPEQLLPLVILMHGHGGTREEAGAFERVAAGLARAGIASIRMDFPGSGESTEPFYNNNLTNMQADVRAATDHALRWAPIDTDRIGALGFSMGGRLAMLLAADGEPYQAIALWAAAVDNGARELITRLGGEDRYLQMRAEARANGYVSFTTFWGQEQQLGAQWFTDMEAARPLDAIAAYTGQLLLVHGSADVVVPPAVSGAAALAAESAERVQVATIDGADHGFGLFSDPDLYSEELVRVTVDFLTTAL